MSTTSPDYENLQSRAYRDGMRISSNSWGASTNALHLGRAALRRAGA